MKKIKLPLFKCFYYSLFIKIKIFKSQGPSIQIKKILFLITKIICFVFLLPFAVYLHTFGYRVVNIFPDRIGHLAIEPDCLLKDLILQNRKFTKLIFLAPSGRVCNKHLLRYWQDYFTVIRNPLLCFLFNATSLLLFAKLDVSGYARERYSPHKSYKIFNDWGSRPVLLKLKPDDFKWGWEILKNYGIPNGAWFVCVHNRDSNFSTVDEFLHSHRNGDQKNLVLAVEEIIKRGGWVIRIGSGSSKLLDLIESEKYIDYPTSKYSSDRMDIFLCAQAKFILGNTSGIALVGSVFGTPCALANMAPISATGFNATDISFPKLHWSMSENRYINLQEIYKLGLLDARTASEYEKAKVKLIENSAEDIRDLCIEMLLYLESTNKCSENLLTANHIFNNFPKNKIYSNNSLGKFSLNLFNKYINLF